MKKINIKFKKNNAFFLMSILLFTILISCKESPNNPKEEDKENTGEDIAQMKKQIISNAEVFEMYDNYTTNRIAVLAKPLKEKYGEKFNDTRTVLFDFKVLKEYIKYVEAQSKKHNITPEGIKIGFGVSSSSAKYANQTNVFFVPTTSNDGKQSAYTITNDKLLYFKNIKTANETNQGTIQKGSFLTFSAEDGGLTLSGGFPAPPPSNTDPDFQ